MIDHNNIKFDALYKCSGCKSVVFGLDLDWIPEEPHLTICPVCDNHTDFVKV